MAEGIKLVGSEIALSTANTVSLGSVVRCYNNTAAAVLITRANSTATIGTCTLAAGATEYYIKLPADTLAAGATIKAAPAAYS